MADFKFKDQTNAIIQIRRGPEADRKLNNYSEGELFYTTDKKRLFIGDGSSNHNGGTLVGNKVWISDSFDKLPQIQTNDLVYITGDSLFYLLTGSVVIDPKSYVKVGGAINQTTSSTYELPNASSDVLGGVKIRSGLVSNGGLLSVDYDSNTLQIVNNKLTVKSVGNVNIPLASYATIGALKVTENTGLVLNDNSLSLKIDNRTLQLSSTPQGYTLRVNPAYLTVPSLPIANSAILGGIKVGDGLLVQTDGMLSVDTSYFDSTPIGSVSWFATSAAPDSYLECDGSVLRIADYNDLYQIIGTTFNTGASSLYYSSENVLTGFGIPDLRGEFVRGWDHGRNIDMLSGVGGISSRPFGSWEKGTLIGWDQLNDAVYTISTTTDSGSTTQFIVGADSYAVSAYSGVAGIRGVASTTSVNLRDLLVRMKHIVASLVHEIWH